MSIALLPDTLWPYLQNKTPSWVGVGVGVGGTESLL